MDRILFDNNKIVEALCQFTFRSPQDNTIYGQYWDILQATTTYNTKENISAISFTVSGGDPGIAPTLMNAMRYANSTKDKIIQLQSNNISIHKVKNYQKWELFKIDIDDAIKSFNKVANKTIISRIDLRAINVFDFPVADFNLSDYFNVNISHPGYIANANANITLEFPLERRNHFAVLRLKTSRQEKINVVLDLSFVNIESNFPSDDLSKIDEVLQYGHIELYKLFSSVITEKTKALIK